MDDMNKDDMSKKEDFNFEWNYNFNRKIQLFSLKPVDDGMPE